MNKLIPTGLIALALSAGACTREKVPEVQARAPAPIVVPATLVVVVPVDRDDDTTIAGASPDAGDRAATLAQSADDDAP